MYTYNGIPQYSQNMYSNNATYRPINSNPKYINQNSDRFVGGGFIAPLLLGGVAGYAIGNNRPNYYPAPYPQPKPIYYNNYYYPYY